MATLGSGPDPREARGWVPGRPGRARPTPRGRSSISTRPRSRPPGSRAVPWPCGRSSPFTPVAPESERAPHAHPLPPHGRRLGATVRPRVHLPRPEVPVPGTLWFTSVRPESDSSRVGDPSPASPTDPRTSRPLPVPRSFLRPSPSSSWADGFFRLDLPPPLMARAFHPSPRPAPLGTVSTTRVTR